MTRIGLFARSALFLFGEFLITPPFALIALLTFPFPPLTRYRIISEWSRLVVALAKVVLGIRYRVVKDGPGPG